MINNINNKYKCAFSSTNSNYNNKYIQSSKFISNDCFLIFNDKSIIKYDFDYNKEKNSIETINKQNEYFENNFIYDFDIITDNNFNLPYICICSKDNPIRILNNDLSLVKSYSLESKLFEKYLSSTFIKYEAYGMNLFTGKNFLSKIDLIKEKEIFTKFNTNYHYLSSFDFNNKYSCYFLGSYNGNLLLCDYKTDKIIEIFKQENPINEIKILNTKEYQMLVGYRNSDYISLFDIRNMKLCINKFERNALTTKKINFVVDKDENFIYSGDLYGNIIRYSFNNDIDASKENNQNIFLKEIINIDINNCITSIDLDNLNNLLIVTYGKNNLFENDCIKDNKEEKSKIENEGKFEIFKIY